MIELLAFGLVFLAGLFIGDAIGWLRHRWWLNRAISQGRMKLTVSRSYIRGLKFGRW